MNGLLIGKVGAVLVVAGGSAGVTWAVTDDGSDLITTAGPAAWVDDPLDGSVLPSDVGEVIVVAHATDPDGIVEIVLLVDGAEVDSADTGGDDLEKTEELRWTPGEPGTYELRAFGRDSGGATTPPGVAKVQVGTDEEQPATTTTTTAPADSSSSTEVALESTTTTASGSTTTRPVTGTTATTASTTTSTTAPTTTTCVPGPTRNLAPANGALRVDRTAQLEWFYEGCPPDTFTIELALDPDFLRGKLTGTAPGSDRRWVSPELACGTKYWFHVRALSGTNEGDWSTSTYFTVVLC